MAPEAVGNLQQRGPFKLGRASDIRSLGIILYQLVYGRTPYSHLQPMQRLLSIADPGAKIAFPAPPEGLLKSTCAGTDAGADSDIAVSPSSPSPSKQQQSPAEQKQAEALRDLLDVLQGCLRYSASERWSIPELLQHRFLNPPSSNPAAASPNLPEE